MIDRLAHLPSLYLAILGITVFAGTAVAEENASNPLAAVSNVDLRWQFTSADAGDRHNVFVDGAYMVHPKLKLKYELHYNFTDVTGSDENDFEKVVIKPIYFPFESKLSEDWGLRGAVGFDWTVEFGNEDKGIGVGADTIAPFFGFAFAHNPSGLTLIPLLQQFVSYDGDTDVNQTSARLIAIKPFGEGYWVKLDAKIPYDASLGLVMTGPMMPVRASGCGLSFRDHQVENSGKPALYERLPLSGAKPSVPELIYAKSRLHTCRVATVSGDLDHPCGSGRLDEPDGRRNGA